MNENQTQAVPLYAQIKEKILEAIAHDELKIGDQLPSQRELGLRYSASHMTVRRAIDELVKMGAVSAIPGKGLYVAAFKQETESSPTISFTEDMARRGMKATSHVLEASMVVASTFLAKTLEIEVGSELVYLHRLRLAESRPMALQTTYVVHACCPGLLKFDFNQNSLYAILKSEYDLIPSTYSVTVEAGLANKEESQLLGLTYPSPLLITEQITSLEDGRPLEYVHTAYRGDRYRLRIPQ
jgi:GntR family transcriptional regulator